eukprot:2142056-Rhodomonas_salina.1
MRAPKEGAGGGERREGGGEDPEMVRDSMKAVTYAMVSTTDDVNSTRTAPASPKPALSTAHVYACNGHG